MASTNPQRWAHAAAHLSHKGRAGIPTEWTLVLPTPEGYCPGYVLLDVRRDRPLRAWAAQLEFRHGPEDSSA